MISPAVCLENNDNLNALSILLDIKILLTLWVIENHRDLRDT